MVVVHFLFWREARRRTMFQPIHSRAVARNSKWRRCKDWARRCERGEDPAVGRHGARVPVAVEHRRLLSSACAHWHRKVQRSGKIRVPIVIALRDSSHIDFARKLNFGYLSFSKTCTAGQKSLVIQNAPQAGFFDQVLMRTLSY